MLNRRRLLGFSIVELMIAIVVLAMLLVIGGPSFSQWLHNIRIRNMADGLQNGLQLARAEAVRRNATVRFQLTNGLTNSCALSTSGSNWVVSMDSAVGACASTNMADDAVPAAPRMIQSRPVADGTSGVVVAADASSVVFNGLGRVTPTPGADIAINVSNPAGGDCAADSGPMRCLRLVVGAAGQIRMCDPRTSFNGTTEGC